MYQVSSQDITILKMEMDEMENSVRYHRTVLRETLEKLDAYTKRYEQIETAYIELQEKYNELEAKNRELEAKNREPLQLCVYKNE